eukprot:s2660_g5.t1
MFSITRGHRLSSCRLRVQHVEKGGAKRKWMAASGPRKKFANSNLNTLLGAPKESAKANYGPAVRSGGVVKPVAKPKGLVSLGKAPASSTVSARKGAAWNQLEEEAKKRAEEESAKKQDDSRPDWVAQEEEEVPGSDEPRELPTASGSTEELRFFLGIQRWG